MMKKMIILVVLAFCVTAAFAGGKKTANAQQPKNDQLQMLERQEKQLDTVFAQGKPRLAILPFTGGKGGDGETIADLFSTAPEIRQVFDPVPRTGSIEAIIREQQFQYSTGLTDSDTIARLGRQYNADYVLAGHIQVFGNNHNLVLITIIHVESLQQIAGDYREYQKIEDVQGIIFEMAKHLAAAVQLNRNNLPTLAVLPFAISVSDVNQSDAEVLAQLLATEIANSDKYAVLPRTSQIQAVMLEHQIQRSGLTDPDSIKVIGNALNAEYVLAGNVRSLGQNNMFTVQVLHVETGVLIGGAHRDYKDSYEGIDLMEELALEVSGKSTENSRRKVRETAERQQAEEKRKKTPEAVKQPIAKEWKPSKWPAVGKAFKAAAKATLSFFPHYIGAGSTFSTPLLTLSLYNHKTIFPDEYDPVGCFVDYGCDFGFFHAMSEIKDVTYYSFYPNAHINLALGSNEYYFHLGAGAGYMIATYRFPGDTSRVNTMAFDAAAGVKIKYVHLLYNIRTNFTHANHKVTAGFYIPY